MQFNVIEDEFIPVLGLDGGFRRVGIREALTAAGRIRQIAASNPMDNVSLLRLLLAVLQWCKPTPTPEELKRFRDPEAGGIPPEWLVKRLGPPGKPNAAFELLGNGARFFQAAPAAPKRPVSDLFAYLPAGTEINHFCHITRRSVVLCPACCAVGLIRLPACATQGGQGKSPSINNAPPIYFVPTGTTLLGSLVLNWPLPSQADDHPAWEEGAPGDGGIGVLEGFTWQPRRTWLGALMRNDSRRCVRCGADGALVSSLVFEKGRRRGDDDRSWRDPQVAWDTSASSPNDGTTDDKDHALRAPDPLKLNMAEAALWRRAARAILQSHEETATIPSVANAPQRARDGCSVHVRCHEPFTKQAKCLDEYADSWRIPPNVLHDANRRSRALRALDELDQVKFGKVFARALPRNARGRPEIEATCANLAAETERQSKTRFVELIARLAKADSVESLEQCIVTWRKAIRDDFLTCLTTAYVSATPGSPLRRREAEASVRQAIDHTLQKVARAKPQESAAQSPAEPSRRKQKRGTA